jgi:transcriptional regulator with XRE-family HTH domain
MEANDMAETRLQRAIRQRQVRLGQSLIDELARVIEIEGISLRALGRAVGVDPSPLARFLRGRGGLSQESLVAVATGLCQAGPEGESRRPPTHPRS